MFLFLSLFIFLYNQVGAFVNVAAAEGQDKVAFLGFPHNVIGDLLKGAEVAGTGDLCLKVAGVDVVGVLLTDS